MNSMTSVSLNIVTVARETLSNTKQNTDANRHNNENFSILPKSRSAAGTDFPEISSDVHDEEEVDQNLSDEPDYEEKIMAVYCKSGRLGAACYNVYTSELHVLDEIADRPPGYQMLDSLYRQVEPSYVLAENKRQNAFLSRLRAMVFDGESDSSETRCKLILVSSKEYNYEACKRRIYSLSLCGEPPHCSDDERIMYLRTVTNFNSTSSVHALGTLLRYLDMNWPNIVSNPMEKPNYLQLKKISLTSIMYMDQDTYRGLQIFSRSSHPSAFKRGAPGSSREGLSLYSLFNKCCSRPGRTKMRILLQRPTCDVTTLRRRQDALSWLMKPKQDAQMLNLCSSLRHIRNVNGILLKMKSLTAKPYQWKSLYTTLCNALLICEILEQARDSDLLEELASTDNTKLYQMAQHMNTIIDFEASQAEDKFTIRQGLDSELDKKKQTLSNLHGLMSDWVRKELAQLPPQVTECSMLYMPHLGYILAVRADAVDAPQHNLPGLRFMFRNNEYVHYKSKGCEELDVMIGDTYPEIRAHETKIMMRLVDVIIENISALSTLIDNCAELDCLIAIAKVCKEHGFVRPVFTDNKVIKIKQGKHPLHLISSENFVPNDTSSSVEDGLVKILTGANSSGKSVYMKQVALICYLAHVGSFVPAESAVLSPLARVHTRMQSTECVAAHMSAFLIDLGQMSSALQEFNSNSLILIDEFGKGTSEVDGLALLAACLNHFLFQGEQAPHVLVSTHFLNIKEFLVKTPLVRFQTFEHVIQDGEPVFLYRLAEGTAERSFALEVAAASGLDPRLLRRAAEIQKCIKENKLPGKNTRITTKIKTFIDSIKNDLLADNF